MDEPVAFRISLDLAEPRTRWGIANAVELMLRNVEMVTAVVRHGEGALLEIEAFRDQLNGLVGAMVTPATLEEQATATAVVVDALRDLLMTAVMMMVEDSFDGDEVTVMRRVVSDCWPSLYEET